MYRSRFARQLINMYPEAHLVRCHHDKTPVGRWRNHPATEEEIAIWSGLVGLVPASVRLAGVDVDKGGDAGVRAASKVLGADPVVVVRSRRAGRRHAYFLLPPGAKAVGNFSWQIGDYEGDFRGDSGYMLLHGAAAIKIVVGLHKLDQFQDVNPTLLKNKETSTGIRRPANFRRSSTQKNSGSMGSKSFQRCMDEMDWRNTSRRNCTLLSITRSILGKPSYWNAGQSEARVIARRLACQFKKNDHPFDAREIERTADRALAYREANLASGELQRRSSAKQAERGKKGGMASARAKQERNKFKRRSSMVQTAATRWLNEMERSKTEQYCKRKRAQGKSIRWISKHCGLSVGKVHSLCKDIQLPAAQIMEEWWVQRSLTLRKQGLSIRQIAKRVRFSKSKIGRICKGISAVPSVQIPSRVEPIPDRCYSLKSTSTDCSQSLTRTVDPNPVRGRLRPDRCTLPPEDPRVQFHRAVTEQARVFQFLSWIPGVQIVERIDSECSNSRPDADDLDVPG